MDLSRQFSQENEKNIWYIEHEQLNATRWKTSLFIKVNQLFRRFRYSYLIFSVFQDVYLIQILFVEQ